MWEEMLPLLHPFTIALASLASRKVRSMCVSSNGLLIVPYIIVFCDDFDGSGNTDRTLRALPAIEKGEVVEIEICDGNALTNQLEMRDRFSLFLGWLLGPFNKLRAVSIDVEFAAGDRSLWVTVLQNLKRHCPALEHLSIYSYPDEVIHALPAFRGLSSLHMAVHATPDASAALILERLADCSAALPILESLLLEISISSGSCLASLQRCLDAFPICCTRIIEIADMQSQTIGILPGTLSKIRWPPKCESVSLSSYLSAEDLCMLAEQICLGAVNCLYISTSPVMVPARIKEFLDALHGSKLKCFGWAFLEEDLPEQVLKAIREASSSLIQHLRSLRLLEISTLSAAFEQPHLAALAQKHTVHVRSPDARRFLL